MVTKQTNKKKQTLILASFVSRKIDKDPKCTHFSKSLVQSSILLLEKNKNKKGPLHRGREEKAERWAEPASLSKAREGRWQLRREEEGMPCCGFVCFCVSV